MAATTSKSELVAIVGPTASGKSELALRLAKEFNGEIIAADSRTIYIGMDIGTAKPTPREQTEVPHWGLDLVEPGRPFSAYKFKKYAQKTVTDIQKRGKLPILVGGTGLYIDAVLFDFGFSSPSDTKERKRLEGLSTEELQQIIKERGYRMPKNSQNQRHLVRAIERDGLVGSQKSLRQGVIMIGLRPKDEILRRRINLRAEQIFSSGVVKETKRLQQRFGKDALLSTGGIIYKICIRLLNQEIEQNEALELFKSADWQYARRQKTWFRRNKFIQWYKTPDEAFTSVSKLLNK